MRFTIAPSVPARAVDDGSESSASGSPRRASASLARRIGVTVVAAVALVAFGVSGCSDSDGDTETPVASQSAPEVPETIAATATIAAEEAPTQSATPEPTAESATPEPTASNGPITVAQVDIEAALARDLQAQTGEQFSVDCPGDLVAVAGTQVVCTTVVPTGEVYNVKMTVTSVADGRLNYSMEAFPAS
ncbi:DUF4333 domain-containing protein [Frankia sp. CNm7]|uniref:DUF4333 domain-containing protein n=1 Tax=Frankia nepalensis TaxID=1836974 RepID=A0A937RPW5_9ACTN|nr:DUF4333 domain-containing protein [Frankia nepalensis]MBL7495743.1 DUF4333 domain-containing protein [Frankia nepalensis]MBL7509017.1 DUF4333 domain-containing protein [Frankia nepalensis]MBL7523472.1 DUF4333 domain-containing protein [Frankia nepalensis]MBL7629816.1 DUF4333 domain-containing protein [Frankia nepalensis]